MKIKKTLLILFGLSFVLLSACNDDVDDIEDTKGHSDTITVGALLSITGNWATLGKTSEAAIDIALEDINHYMEEIGSDHRFATKVYDTKLDPDLALEHLKKAKEEGMRFVLGPQSSSEVAAVKSYADNNQIFVVSQGSTAGSLSLPDDNIFRFCPDGELEGEALAKTIYNAGIRGLVTISRDDVGNTGLEESTGQAFTELGGTLYHIDHYADDISDFDPVITSIENKLNTAITTHGNTAVGVYVAAFDEGADLFAEANNNQLLNSVNWYGGDGMTKSEAFTNNASAAEFAMATGFFAPAFGLPSSAISQWEPLKKEIESRTGIEPGAFALATYDALWVIALTYNATETTNHDVGSIRKMFKKQAEMYFGATGSTQLNENGDRTIASFGFWGIEIENGSYSWVLVGSSE